MAGIIGDKIARLIDKYSQHTQHGLRSKHSLSQATHIVRRIEDAAEAAGKPFSLVLLDWEKAFDRVNHDKIFEALKRFRIHPKMINLIKHYCNDPEFYVEIDNV